MHTRVSGVLVERGLSGVVPGSEPAYVAMCHFHFSSVDDFCAVFLPHAALLQGDMANYTDIDPVIQFSKISISQ